jgi:Zn-dependent protease with chaperone function
MSNQTLSPVEDSALNIHEFILLHEAGHRKNADSTIVTAGAQITQEHIIRTAMLFSADNPGYLLSTLVNGIDFLDSILEKEKRADNFACKHAASTDVLQGGLKLFNYISMSGYGQFDFLHPNSQQRAQKVVDEIQRRWIDENTCPADK